MWYVMRVPTGMEQSYQRKCEQRIKPPVLEKSFLPYYDEMRKQGGAWTIRSCVLFPGYVFMQTREPEELQRRLRQIPGWKSLVTVGAEIVPITPAEEALLQELGHEEQVIPVSRGIIQDNEIIVTEGPLKGKEAYIRRIDRHKRRAYLEWHLASEVVEAGVSLEIYAKNQPERKYKTELFNGKHAVVSLEDGQTAQNIQSIYMETKKRKGV